MTKPETRYAKSDGVSLAYQVVGDGPHELILVPGFVSHVEVAWEQPRLAHFLSRLASFSRLIVFDKRGSGMSDPVDHPPSMEQRMDDIRAVMDAAGSRRATLFGVSEGGTLSLLFAHKHPERTQALVLYGSWARRLAGPPTTPTAPRLSSSRTPSSEWTGRGRPARGGMVAARVQPTMRSIARGGRGTCGWRRAPPWRRTPSI